MPCIPKKTPRALNIKNLKIESVTQVGSEISNERLKSDVCGCV